MPVSQFDEFLPRLGLMSLTQRVQATYTDKPNANLSFSRLINQEKDFYKTKEGIETTEFKILILTERIDNHPSALSFLKHWLTHKRPLYCFHHGEAYKIESEAQLNTHLPFMTSFINPAIIYEKLAEKNIAADNIAILNTYKLSEIESISTAENSVQAELAASSLSTSHTLYLQTILDNGYTLKEAIQSLTEYDGCLYFSIDFEYPLIKPLINVYQAFIETDAFSTIVIDEDDLDMLYQALLNSPRMLKVQKIKIENIDILSEKFIYLLQHCPHFSALEVISWQARGVDKTSRVHEYFKKLKSLTLQENAALDFNFNLFKECKFEELNLIGAPYEAIKISTNNYFEAIYNSYNDGENEVEQAQYNKSIYKNFVKSLNHKYLKKLYWQDFHIDLSGLFETTELIQLTLIAPSFTTPAIKPYFLNLVSLTCKLAATNESKFAIFFERTPNLELLDIQTQSYTEIEDEKGSEFHEQNLIEFAPKRIKKLNASTCGNRDSNYQEATYTGKCLATASAAHLTHLQIIFAEEDDLDFTFTIFPKLETLILERIISDNGTLENSMICSIFEKTPHLKTFEYIGDEDYFEDDDNSSEHNHQLNAFQLKKLSHLSISPYPLPHLVKKLISTSDHIESLHLKMYGDSDTGETASDLASHPQLRKNVTVLKIDASNRIYLKPILHTLAAHSLETMDLDDFKILLDIPIYDSLVMTLKDIYSYSNEHKLKLHPDSQLKHLTVHGMFISSFYLGFNACHQLESLTLIDCKVDDINKLIIYLNNIPSLRTLTLKNTLFNNIHSTLQQRLQLPLLTSFTTTGGRVEYKLIEAMPHLIFLNIVDGPLPYHNKMKKIIKTHKQLKHLSLPLEEEANSGPKSEISFPGISVTLNKISSKEEKSSKNASNTLPPANPFSLNEKNKYSTREFFLPKANNPIHTANYRLTPYIDKFNLEGKSLAFQQSDINDLYILSEDTQTRIFSLSQLRKKYDSEYISTTDVFYGKFPLLLRDDLYTFLPSLSPQDEILHIKSSAPITIVYSKKAGMYAICLTSGYEDEVTIELVLKTQFESLSLGNDLDNYIEAGRTITNSLFFFLTKSGLLTQPSIASMIDDEKQPEDLVKYFLEKNLSDGEILEDLFEDNPDTPIAPMTYELFLDRNIETIYETLNNLMKSMHEEIDSFYEVDKLLNGHGLTKNNLKTYTALMKSLYAYFNTFGIGSLTPHNDTADSLLNTLIKDHNGACRHRSFLFKAIDDSLGLSSRLITNECHAYIEIPSDGTLTRWITLNLGGYPASIISTPTYLTKSQKLKRKAAEMAAPAKPEPLIADGDTSYVAPTNQEPVAEDQAMDVQLELDSDDEDELDAHSAALHTSSSDNTSPPREDFTIDLQSNPFVTWTQDTSDEKSFDFYWQSLREKIQQLPRGTQNILITVPNNTILEQLSLSLINYQKNINSHSLYLSSLNDIQFTSAIVEDGEYRIGSSELVEFIQAPPSASPNMLIVNWTDHKPKHIGFNTLIDSDKRKLGAHLIPNDMIVIALITSDKTKSLREDFYSRFRIKSHASLDMTFSLPHKSLVHDNQPYHSINLMNDDDWRNQLVGSIGLDDNEIVAKEGAIIDAIKQNVSQLKIFNAPLHEAKAIQAFLNEMLIKGFVYFNGNKYALPQHFAESLTNKPYTYEGKYSISVVTPELLPLIDWVINAETFDSLFYVYTTDEGNNLTKQPGRISESTRDKIVTLFVTSYLSDGEWAKLIELSFTTGTELHLVVRDLNLPSEMLANQLPPSLSTPTRENLLTSPTRYYAGNDINYMLDKVITTPLQDALKFTVTPDMGSEIFEDAAFQIVKETKTIHTQHVLGVLGAALLQGKTVILKIAAGMLSPALEQALESLFLPTPFLVINGTKHLINGHLIVCSESADYFKWFNHKIMIDQTPLKQIESLETSQNTAVFSALKKLMQAAQLDLSYTQVKTFLKRNHEVTLQNILPFVLGFKNVEAIKVQLSQYFNDLQNIAVSMDIDTDKDISTLSEFEETAKMIVNWLDQNPTLFLMGPTGTGKSTIVLHTLPPFLNKVFKRPPALFVGLEKLSEWAASPGENLNLLFVDEANLLSEGAIQMFEDLYNENPGIVLNSNYLPLSKNHKVIFAGNLSHYAGRVLHTLGAKYGIYTELPAISEPTLINTFIKPYITLSAYEDSQAIDIQSIAEIALRTYRFINTETNAVFTPRNLKNLSLRFQLMQTQLRKATPEMMWLACYDELRYLVDTKTKQQFRTLIFKSIKEVDYKTLKKELITLSANNIKLLNYAETHAKSRRMIHDFLMMNTAFSGLILEGMPGVGKSTLMQKYLEALNISYVTLHATTQEDAKVFLENAFHQGLVVIIDELNTMPFLEYILNALMMGEDLAGQKAQQPGFRVIATQNPITFGGRYALTDALQNRFLKVNLKDYHFQDLMMIAKHKGASDEDAFILTREFVDAKRYSQLKQLKPSPTPRDFIAKLTFFSQKEDTEMPEEKNFKDNDTESKAKKHKTRE